MNTVTVLVAEDDDNDKFLLQHAFRKASVDFLTFFVHDGQAAIDYLVGCGNSPAGGEGGWPTVLLLDLKMPGLDGFQVLQWLQANPAFKRLWVIAFSSSTDPADASRARGLGADDYVIKPHAIHDYIQFARGLEQRLVQLQPTLQDRV